MRLLIMGDLVGDLGRSDMMHRLLDAAHAKNPIDVVLYNGPTMAALDAERWANANGILCGDVWEGADSNCIFDLADSVIALPGTSNEFLVMAREREVKVWEPLKRK